MAIFLKMMRLGTCAGISIGDATSLRVCNNMRILITMLLLELHSGENPPWVISLGLSYL